VAILLGPVLIGTILSIATGKAGWSVLVGVYLVWALRSTSASVRSSSGSGRRG